EVRWRRSCLSWALGDRCSLTRIMSPALPLFVRCCGGHRDLRSFPTRRSSDLVLDSGRGTARFHDRRDAVERFLLLLSIDSLRRRQKLANTAIRTCRLDLERDRTVRHEFGELARERIQGAGPLQHAFNLVEDLADLGEHWIEDVVENEVANLL